MSGSTNVFTMMVITFLIANFVRQKTEGATIFVGIGGTSGNSVGLSADSKQCNGGSWLNFCKTDCQKSPEYKSVCSFNTTHDDLDLDKGLVMSQMPQKIGKRSLDSGDDRLLDNLWGNTKYPWGDTEYPWGNSKHPWGDSEHPWGDSKNPWGDSEHPWGDSKNPWGYSDYPWGNGTHPWGNVEIAKVKNSVTYVFNGNVLKKSKGSKRSGGQKSRSDFPRNTENGLCYCSKLHG